MKSVMYRDSILNFLDCCDPGQWIYPGEIHRKLKIPITYVYEVLDSCVDEDIIEQYLDIYCTHCKCTTGYRYKTVAEVPDKLKCKQCNYELQHPLETAIVIYRMK